MLTVTDAAASHLASVLDRPDVPDGAAVRFVAQQQGLTMTLDQPRDDDRTVEHDGKTVLLLDPQIAQLLDNRTLDAEHTQQGTGLTLKSEGGDAPAAGAAQ